MMEDTRQKGFTLMELMVAMAISGMLMAVVTMAFTGQSKSYNSGQDIASLQQDMRSALQLMAEDIRMAGYDPTGSADAKISDATSSNLRFTKDIGDGAGGDSDGDTSDANEDIRYAINTNGSLGRETGGAGGLQPIAENVERLMYEYNLDDGTWVAQALTPADRAKIRAVKITILAHSARETAGAVDNSAFYPAGWTSTARGRYHWRIMSLIVQCRNIQIKAS